MDVTRIQVVTNGALEQCCVLRNNSQSPPEVQESNGRRIQAVNAVRDLSVLAFNHIGELIDLPDVARYGFNDAEKCQRERALASSSSVREKLALPVR